MTKNMYTVAGDGPCNEELALRMQAGDKNAAERLVSQNEGYLTDLARAYTPWCKMEDLKQEAALALERDNCRASELKYQQGTISKNALLDARDKVAAAEKNVETARHDLFTAYRTYCWAVNKGIVN